MTLSYEGIVGARVRGGQSVACACARRIAPGPVDERLSVVVYWHASSLVLGIAIGHTISEAVTATVNRYTSLLAARILHFVEVAEEEQEEESVHGDPKHEDARVVTRWS